jgi:glycosyltransferase involved in cell wall biosynthesis
MRILSFSYDTNLLLPEDAANESQYRQRRYCELLDQERAFVVLNSGFPHQERTLANGRIWAISASAKSKWRRVCLAYRRGIRTGHRFRPHIVEYQDPQLAGWAAYLAAQAFHVPLVGGVFNDFLDNPTWLKGAVWRRFYNQVGKFVLSRSFRVRCDSAETTRSLHSKGYTQVRYIPFFVPWLESFAVPDEVQRARLKRWQDDPLILCVARLSEEKNIALLLQAFGRVTSASPRGRLVVVGSGPLREELEHLASGLGIAQRVSWPGAVETTALPGYYREANVFALSSNSETSARVLIMAQASRLPTLTTATSGSRDIVSDGQTGCVTPVGDVGAFAEALGRLLNDETAYWRLMEAGEYDALERYGERVITNELQAFYRDLVPAR